jgi:hypothetical protein
VWSLKRGRWAQRCLVAVAVTTAFNIGSALPALPVLRGIDRTLCRYIEGRAQIPDNFVVGACFDGHRLYLKNDTVFVLVVSATGVGAPERVEPTAPELASMAVFDGTDDWTIPPGYGLTLPIGSGAASVTVKAASENINRSYAFAHAMQQTLSVYGGAQVLISKLEEAQIADQACHEARSDPIGNAGCLLQEGFATWQAVIASGLQLASGPLGGLIDLIDTWRWTEENIVEADKYLRKWARVLDISATPSTWPEPKQANIEGTYRFKSDVIECVGLNNTCGFNGTAVGQITSCDRNRCHYTNLTGGFGTRELVFDGSSWRAFGTLTTVSEHALTCYGEPRPTSFRFTVTVISAEPVRNVWTAKRVRISEIDTAQAVSTDCLAAKQHLSAIARRG